MFRKSNATKYSFVETKKLRRGQQFLTLKTTVKDTKRMSRPKQQTNNIVQPTVYCRLLSLQSLCDF